MRVVLDAASVRQTPLVDLMVLLWIGAVGRHRLIVDDEQDPDYQCWLSGLPSDIRADWSDAVSLSLLEDAESPSYHEVHVTARAHSTWSAATPSLAFRDALALLLSPYRILLESGFSDRAFLLSVCDERQRGFLQDRLSREWVEIEHGGGIEDLRKRVEQVRGDRGRRMRYSVLFDSDSTVRGTPGPGAVNAKRACENGAPGIADLVVHHHQLARRAIENYLPVAALERWRDRAQGGEQLRRKNLVKAFLSLTDEQRFFLHMKDGFSKPYDEDLFAGVDQKIRDLLATGFDTKDEKIADMYRGMVKPGDFDESHPDREALRVFVREIIARIR